MPAHFVLRLGFVKATEAYAKSFYPGARQVSDTEVMLESERYLDVLTFLWFAAR